MASDQTWRNRTQKKYPIQGKRCLCGKPAKVRHHVNGKLSDLSPRNIELLCRACHVRRDVRIKPHRS